MSLVFKKCMCYKCLFEKIGHQIWELGQKLPHKKSDCPGIQHVQFVDIFNVHP